MAAIFQIFRNHWFKIAMLTIVTLFFMKKEISFQINLRNREAQPKEKVQTGRYTESRITEHKTDDTFLSIFNLFEMLPTGKNLKEAFEATSQAQKVSFVKRFGKVAKDEQIKFGIPASVILAEAMIQSSVGTREMAVQYNNFFALPCGKHWKGAHLTEGTECYRAYSSAWESFRDHSIFLTKSIEQPNTKDYKAWVAAIADSFGTKEDYATLLVEVIEQYELFLLDK
jgi:flagellum-specific peptidoglycan hydrolase FlgJ